MIGELMSHMEDLKNFFTFVNFYLRRRLFVEKFGVGRLGKQFKHLSIRI